jgi:hypothetical protein
MFTAMNIERWFSHWIARLETVPYSIWDWPAENQSVLINISISNRSTSKRRIGQLLWLFMIDHILIVDILVFAIFFEQWILFIRVQHMFIHRLLSKAMDHHRANLCKININYMYVIRLEIFFKYECSTREYPSRQSTGIQWQNVHASKHSRNSNVFMLLLFVYVIHC